MSQNLPQFVEVACRQSRDEKILLRAFQQYFLILVTVVYPVYNKCWLYYTVNCYSTMKWRASALLWLCHVYTLHVDYLLYANYVLVSQTFLVCSCELINSKQKSSFTVDRSFFPTYSIINDTYHINDIIYIVRYISIHK